MVRQHTRNPPRQLTLLTLGAVVMVSALGCGGGSDEQPSSAQAPGCHDVDVESWVDVDTGADAASLTVRVPQPRGWHTDDQAWQQMAAMAGENASPIVGAVVVGPTATGQVPTPTFTVAVNEVASEAGSTPESILTDHVDTYTQAIGAEGTLVRSPSPTSVCDYPARSYVSTATPTAVAPHPPNTYRAVAVISAGDRIYEAQLAYSPYDSPDAQTRDDLATMLNGIHIATRAGTS